MTEEELASVAIRRYMDLLRIQAAKNRDVELGNQLREAKAQLQALGIPTEELTIEAE